MKEIIIKCIINQTLITNQPITIKKNNQVIENGFINNEGYYIFKGIEGASYTINILGNSSSFVILKGYKHDYIFNFQPINSTNKITIYLYDNNYQKYKIERGIIYLWPNHIQ